MVIKIELSLSRTAEAHAAYSRALDLTQQEAGQRFLRRRLEELGS